MRVVSTIAFAVLLFSGFVSVQAEGNFGDWIQLKLKNGNLLNGHVVNVTEENVHLVGASINRLIPKDQLDEKSLLALNEKFPISIAPKTAESATAEKLKVGLQAQRTALYQNVSDVYSPYTYSRSYHRSIYTPYRRTYYLPRGRSLAYPVYRHYYRPSHSFPRWSVNIDL